METIKRKGKTPVLKQEMVGEAEYLTFPSLTDTKIVTHLFSTRLGGVSKGDFASMNLSYTRGDEKASVDENYKRIAKLLDRRTDDFVLSKQTHSTNVRVVSKEDKGKGMNRPLDYEDVDGFVTNISGIVLGTVFADCVPLFFVDPVKKAIGLSHSGWKGTAKKMGKETVRRMQEEYDCRPSDIIAAIGPSICVSCYEVGEDVASQFGGKSILFPKDNGKYQLDLWQANVEVLREAGILEEHISVTDICTCCNRNYLFSHRASGGKRGNLGAFLSLNEKRQEDNDVKYFSM